MLRSGDGAPHLRSSCLRRGPNAVTSANVEDFLWMRNFGHIKTRPASSGPGRRATQSRGDSQGN